jgi:hypothetical protein
MSRNPPHLEIIPIIVCLLFAQIEFVGAVQFYLEDPRTGAFVLALNDTSYSNTPVHKTVQPFGLPYSGDSLPFKLEYSPSPTAKYISLKWFLGIMIEPTVATCPVRSPCSGHYAPPLALLSPPVYGIAPPVYGFSGSLGNPSVPIVVPPVYGAVPPIYGGLL